MICSTKILRIFCLAMCVSACDGELNENDSSGANVLPQENAPANTVPAILTARELEILNKIEQRALVDGARYQFSELNPVFVQDGDTMNVSFDFVEPNTVGGSPIVAYSLSQRAITSIVYTR